jgi:hypothetical protein
MSRRSKETLAVQLFPFLAVLVCTMGSLIFLLLVITREIRQRAVAFAAYQQAQSDDANKAIPVLPVMSIPNPEPPPIEIFQTPDPEPVSSHDDAYAAALAERERELSNLKANWRVKANLLGTERDQQRNLLSDHKSLVEASAEKIAALQAEVKRLELELSRLAGETAASEETTDSTDRIILEQQIALMKKRLRAAQVADATTSNDQFQVVPFDPQTGTNRRPILIECTAAGIRFMPEDILITADDMQGFNFKVNPLAVGTGALINYWTAWNRKQRQPQIEPEPYVLLLVRPDGVYSYYVAMKMLEPIRTAQGYELIEESTALNLPEVDPGAKLACQTAVNRLLQERENIYRAAVRGGSTGSVFGGSPGRKGAGTGQSFGTERGLASAGNGGSERSGGNTFTMDDITGGENAVGNRSWERVENFQGRPRGPRSSGIAGQQAYGMANGNGNSGEPQSGSDEEWDAESSDDSPSSDPKNPQNRGSTKKRSMAQRGAANSKGSQRGGSSNGGKSDPSQSGSPQSGMSQSGSSQYGGDEPDSGMPIGERPGRKQKRSNPDGEPADAEDLADVEPDSETGSGDAGGGEPGGTSRTRSGNSAGSSKLSGNGSGSRFSHKQGSSTRPARRGEKPSKSTDDPDKPLEPEMLVGRRWGYCEMGASIGFEREVRVDVSEGKLVIAEKHVIPVGEGETRTETLERFATALDGCTREWGRPPQGFFWAPKLKFVVKPEAYGKYEQINGMMTRAGLATSHEFAKDSKSTEFGRATPSTTKPTPKTTVAPRTGGFQ